MVAGPPCSNCGWTLRWVPEQNAWGCDRCRSVFPAQQQPQPAPQPQAAQSWAQPNLGTASGVARAGGAFGGSAGGAGRSNSAAPGQYQATPSQFSMPASPSPSPQYPPAQQPYPSQPPVPAQQAYPSQPPAPAQQSYLQQPAQGPSTQPSVAPGGYPQNTYGTPGAQPATANLAPKPKSKRGLLIAIGGVVAVGAGIAIAVGMSGGGKSTRGLASKDEVIKATLTALTAGDDDALIKLIDLDAFGDFVECTEAAQKDIEKARKMLSEMTKDYASKAKGVEIELVKEGEAKKKDHPKGSESGTHCKYKVDAATHDISVRLKLKKGSVSKEMGKTIVLGEVDGRWFLSMPPTIVAPGDCALAAKATAKTQREVHAKQGLGDSGVARIEKAVGQACNDDNWPDRAIECFTDAKTDKDNTKCLDILSASQQEKLVGKIKQIVLEDAKSREVPVITEKPAPPDPKPDAGSGSGAGTGSGSGSATVAEDLPLPPVCDDYKAEIEKLAKCRRIKADIRQAQMKRHDIAVEAYANARKKEAIRESTEKVCKTGLDQVLDLRKTLCR